MRYFIVFASLIIFTASAYAAPKQIEIIGLVPGVSTSDDVRTAEDNGVYVIGGFKIFCTSDYIDGLLSELSCLTGYISEFAPHTVDRSTTPHGKASNIEVHSALVKGFTKKFGKPTKVVNDTKANKFGAKSNVNYVIWIDKKGNELSLHSMLDRIDRGGFMLQSAQKIKMDKENEQSTNQKRKF